MCLVGFRVFRGAKAARRNERAARTEPQELLGESVKARILRLVLTVGSVAAMALAGGASLKSF